MAKSGRPFPELAPPVFVVQKHKATRLHYDFRLEIGGVLVSWAIPKGPSTKDKRLAIAVDDHVLSYGDFEGRIPAGNYGAGTVIVWDFGRWELQDPKTDPAAALKKGAVKFALHGKKLKGRWALQRFRSAGEKQWLLIKEKDTFASSGDVTSAFPASAVSDRSLEEVESDPNAPELSCEDFG